jgi:[acyl-carrier-protein] S-malonyltransferase
MLAYVFPGQGAQAVGAGKDIAQRWPVARRTFEEADEALGYSISQLCFYGPATKLRLTKNAQPGVLAVSVAILRVLQEEGGLAPDVVTGHSLGEYSALVAAGALAFADALRLVHKRGLFMQEAVPEGEGAMAAIMGASAEQVEAWCVEAAQGQVVSASNFNGPKQTVVAGNAAAVARAVELAEAGGAVGKLLEVSAPFHCSLMAPAARRLAEELQAVALAAPRVPVINNVDAQPRSEAAPIRDLLVRQVTTPVYWERCVRTLVDLGVTDVFEVGCGKTLSGLIRRIEKKIALRDTSTAAAVASLIEAAGADLARYATKRNVPEDAAGGPTPEEVFFGGEPWTAQENGWKVNRDATKIMFPDGTTWDFHDPKAHLF